MINRELESIGVPREHVQFDQPSRRQLTKQNVSRARQQLIRLMQDLNFGTIVDLELRVGEPHFVPPPKLIRVIKLGGQNGPRGEREKADFLLSERTAELFEHLEQLQNGTVTIAVYHGLPTQITTGTSGSIQP